MTVITDDKNRCHKILLLLLSCFLEIKIKLSLYIFYNEDKYKKRDSCCNLQKDILGV